MSSPIGKSQNGWPVYPEGDTSQFVRFTAAGVTFWAASHNVATVFGYFVERFNGQIEIIDRPVANSPTGGDDWSYAWRPVRDQSRGFSNHASATALDLDSDEHPRGVHGTYTRHERDVLRDIINDPLLCDNSGRPVLRHGEFYNSTVDGMHVEVNSGPYSIAQAAAKIRAARAAGQREESEMQLTDKIKLTATAARRLSLANPVSGSNEPRFVEGDSVTVEYLLLWGSISAQEARIAAQLANNAAGLVQP